MPQHMEQKVVPYTTAQLYALVADVGAYPRFLPWCVGARVRKNDGREMVADLTIGFKIFRESFCSRVTLSPPEGDNGPCSILVAYENGPFKYLKNSWLFAPHDQGSTVDFYVDFEFRNIVLQKAIGVVFTEAVHLMVNAFLKRAAKVYGVPQSGATSTAGGLAV
jgi:coenzyme Q-binding protein COQ10